MAKWLVLLLMWWRVSANSGPPSWADGSVLTTAPLGLGSVLLTWPVAENNGLSLIGYLVEYAIFDENNPTPTRLPAFDGRGHPAIRQFVVNDLDKGQTYSFYVTALTSDGTIEYASTALLRTFATAAPIGLDPTVVASASYSVTAGTVLSLAVAGKQPSTGLDQTVGPLCLTSQSASCVPGRNFVAFFQPLCEMTDFNSVCRPLTEANVAWTPQTSPPASTVMVGYDEHNAGDYAVPLLPATAGAYALAVQAVTPGQLLGLYWSNAEFSGEPADTRTDAMIHFNWGTGAVVQWATEYASVRWLGFLSPIATGDYTLRCDANALCDVFVNDERVIRSAGGTGCSAGCVATRSISMRRSQFYRLRVDYVTADGAASVSLQWKAENGLFNSFTVVPSASFQRGAYITGSPLSVMVAPGRATAAQSLVYGSEAAMFAPQAGQAYSLFIQLKDEYDNACSDFSTYHVVVSARPAGTDVLPSFAVTAVPFNVAANDCVFMAEYVYTTTGEYVLTVTVDGDQVSNSPVMQFVRPGVVYVSQSRVSLLPEVPEVGAAFAVTVEARDAFGNAVPNGFTGVDVSYTLHRNWDPVASTNGCGSRTNTTWLISCWSGEFVFLDDSLLTSNAFSTISFGNPLISHYAGDHWLYVRVGDELVTGQPVPVRVAVTGSPSVLPVNSAMSLVQWTTPSRVTAFETDVTAVVLLRDAAGNVLTDRAGEQVELVFTPSGSPARAAVCTYVQDKYYACSSFADTPGETFVSVLVNGVVASEVRGGPPSPPACADVPVCGSPACPCKQTRAPATFMIDVDPS